MELCYSYDGVKLDMGVSIEPIEGIGIIGWVHKQWLLFGNELDELMTFIYHGMLPISCDERDACLLFFIAVDSSALRRGHILLSLNMYASFHGESSKFSKSDFMTRVSLRPELCWLLQPPTVFIESGPW